MKLGDDDVSDTNWMDLSATYKLVSDSSVISKQFHQKLNIGEKLVGFIDRKTWRRKLVLAVLVGSLSRWTRRADRTTATKSLLHTFPFFFAKSTFPQSLIPSSVLLHTVAQSINSRMGMGTLLLSSVCSTMLYQKKSFNGIWASL